MVGPEAKKTKPSNVIDFTVEKIEAIKPPNADREEYRDSKQQGLYLRVTKTGVKTFSYFGRFKGAPKPERKTIGRYPAVKPAEARSRAREYAGQQASGESVTLESRKLRQERTLDALWKLYFEHISQKTKDSAQTKSIYETHIQPRWGNIRLSEIKAVDVEKWHLALPGQILKKRALAEAETIARREAMIREKELRRKIRKHGPLPTIKEEPENKPKRVITGETAANRALEVLRAIFNFGIDDKRNYFTGRNPAQRIDRFKEHSRERFLFPSELAPFFQALAKEPNGIMRDAIYVALFTGQRRSNVFGMQWEHINLEQGEWRIPGDLTKNGDQHVSMLLPAVVEILNRRKKANRAKSSTKKTTGSSTGTAQLKARNSKFVFPSDDSETGHIVDARTAMNRLLAESGITNLTFHDLRRTLGSWLARGGDTLLMIGKVLNHKSPEATAIYARVDRDPIRESMQKAEKAIFEAAGLNSLQQ